MKRIIKNENGFSHVAIAVIAVVVLSAVGFIAFRAYNTKKNVANSENKTNANTENKEESVATKDQEVQQTSFIEFKEAGFKIPAKDAIKDLVYFESDGYIFTSTRFLMKNAYIFQGGVDGIPLNNGEAYMCTPATGPLGIISTKNKEGYALVKDLGDIKVYYLHPQSACSSNDDVIKIESGQLKELQSALKEAQKL